MIGFSPDDEHRQLDRGQIDGPTFGLKFAARQRIVEIESPQIFTMHPARHARTVGVPRHQIIRRFTFAAQVRIDGRRPQQITRAQQRECSAHLLALQNAGALHDRLQHVELARADENRQLSGLAEILLSREQRHTAQSLITGGSQRCNTDRQQGAADAVADRMNFLSRHDA